MKAICLKCGSEDVRTTFQYGGRVVYQYADPEKERENEFVKCEKFLGIYNRQYQYTIKKDCLFRFCRNCGYKWESATNEERLEKDLLKELNKGFLK